MREHPLFYLQHVDDHELWCAVVLLHDLRLRLDQFEAGTASLEVEIEPSSNGLGPDLLDHLIALGFVRLEEVRGAVLGFCAGTPLGDLPTGARNVTLLLRSLEQGVAALSTLQDDA